MFIIAFIIFILILSFLVFVHELGHFIVAKRAGMEVEEFGFGYPPRIYGKKIGETVYSINLLFFGGFVKIKDEERSPGKESSPRGYYAAKPWTKTKMILAGVIVNFLVAVIIYYIILIGQGFNFYTPSMFDHKMLFGNQEKVTIVSSVIKDSVAQKNEIKPYDAILGSGDLKFLNPESVVEFISSNSNKEINLDITNIISGEKRTITVIPEEKDGKGFLGIGLGEVIQVKYASLPQKIFSGFLHSISTIDYSLRVLGDIIKYSFVQGSIGPLANSVVGPVGILALTDATMSGGIWQILNLIGVLSLGFALINVFPIPAADGGRMLFVIYEAIFKKNAPEKFEHYFNLIGNILIIILSIAIAIKDVRQFFFSGKGL